MENISLKESIVVGVLLLIVSCTAYNTTETSTVLAASLTSQTSQTSRTNVTTSMTNITTTVSTQPPATTNSSSSASPSSPASTNITATLPFQTDTATNAVKTSTATNTTTAAPTSSSSPATPSSPTSNSTSTPTTTSTTNASPTTVTSVSSAGSTSKTSKSSTYGSSTVSQSPTTSAVTNTSGSNSSSGLSTTSGEPSTSTLMSSSGTTANLSDIDECGNTPLNNCSIHADCLNTEGSFTCACKHGWQGDGYNCTDIDECGNKTLNNCSIHADCSNSEGSFTCACKHGWQGDGYNCTDTDECSNNTLNNCSRNANCSNTDGSFLCTCTLGWEGDGFTCTDIDECGNKTLNNCSIHADCSNSEGSFTCACKHGWQGDGYNCTDTDECSNNTLNNCSKNANCSNTDGSFLCTCTLGWEGDGFTCTDIDECGNKTLNNCSIHADCSNSEGSFTCACKHGWQGDGYNCTDTDECSNNTLNNCSKNANCSNTDGSFLCTCTLGWEGDGFTCTDIDECNGTSPCDIRANCNNTMGSYSCKCAQGFDGDGHSCTDIDECNGTSPCHKQANCTNTVGSYSCQCEQGFDGDGHSCTDIDECSGTSPCDIWANCTNTEGSYSCECEQGFEGDGHSCTDVDECNGNGTNSCNTTNTDQCINLDGKYFCLCKKGWKGDNCEIIDDLCNVTVNPCSPNASCSYNTSGVFCECNDKYRGNGTTCYRKVLLEQYINETKHDGDDGVYGPYNAQGGIPFNGKVYFNIYVSMNGYITLGQRLNMRYPNLVGDSKLLNNVDFPVIAALWADIETNKESGGLYINENLNATEVNQYFSEKIDKPRFAFMATWKSAVPYPYQELKNSEKADFQVVLVTNGSSTQLMLNYDQEYFTWKVSPGRKVAIGFSGMNKTWQGLADQDNFTDINSKGSDIDGRLEYYIPSGDKTVLQSESMCFDWLQTISYTNLTEAHSDADACPCSIGQARLDRQFQTYDGLNFKSRFPRGRFENTQNCKYSIQGALLTGAPNGGFMTVPSLNIERGFLYCCEQSSRLCKDFYKKVPSQNCAGYTPPSWSLTWGDPHLNTTDGQTYTFNGRGEYTLLQYTDPDSHERTEVQVRTDYVSKNQTSATVFVGLAATLGDNNTLEINLNRSKETLNIFKNGEMFGSFDGTTNINLTGNNFMVFNESGNLIVSLKVGISLLVKFSSILDITTSVSKEKLNGSLEGLLGNNDDNRSNDFVSRNGTEYSSSDESTLYEFASTWRVNKTSSLFNYTLSGKPFEFYNNDSLPHPAFISVLNITEYMIETCGSEIDLSECDDYKPCIIDTAATCNKTFGATTKQTAEDSEEDGTVLQNKPPVLNNSAPAILYLGHKVNKTETLTLTEYFSNDSLKNISVLNVSESLKKVYTYEDYTFNLNITSLDRDGHFPYFVKFIAEDALNATTEYWPSIYYCPCEKEQDCDYSQFMESSGLAERFFVASCNCSDDYIGQYCQSKSCNRYNVTDDCDAGCPGGMEAVDGGNKCYDINECNQQVCDQICTNTIGGFICNCTEGYLLNGETKCVDIDECAKGDKCRDVGQYCKNSPGNYTCECLPGYRKINGTCNKVAKSFGGVLVFKLFPQPPDLVSFTESLVNFMLKGIHLEGTEITEIVEINETRRKRDTCDTNNCRKYRCIFTVYTNANTSQLVNKFEVNAKRFEGGSTIPGIPVAFAVQTEKSKVYSDKDNGICNIPGKTDCDPVSTYCKTTNGIFRCECKKGFERIDFSCQDIDECEKNTTICPSPNGNCTNTHGSFDCMCKPGFMFEGLDCKDLCHPNPCQNDGECLPGNTEGQFFCKCDDEWSGKTCETENSEISRLRTMAIAVGASVGCLCLLLLCVMLGMYRRNKARRLGYTRRPLSAYDDFSLPHTSDFIKRDTPLDDDTAPDESTFSIPRARLRASEYATIEDQSSTQGKEYDGYAGKDNDYCPLTSSKAGDDDDDDNNERFGKSNPSFLHRDGTDRHQSRNTRRNPYEYF